MAQAAPRPAPAARVRILERRDFRPPAAEPWRDRRRDAASRPRQRAFPPERGGDANGNPAAAIGERGADGTYARAAGGEPDAQAALVPRGRPGREPRRGTCRPTAPVLRL